MLCSLLELEQALAALTQHKGWISLWSKPVPAGQAEVGQGRVPLAATLGSWWSDLVTFPCHLPLSPSLATWEGKFAMVCPVELYLWAL